MLLFFVVFQPKKLEKSFNDTQRVTNEASTLVQKTVFTVNHLNYWLCFCSIK